MDILPRRACESKSIISYVDYFNYLHTPLSGAGQEAVSSLILKNVHTFLEKIRNKSSFFQKMMIKKIMYISAWFLAKNYIH